MVDFVNNLELSQKNYQNNVSIRDGNYNGKLLFTIKEFVSLETRHQSMYYFVNQILKRKNWWSTRFTISTCLNFRHNSYFTSKLVRFCIEVYDMWLGNKYFELQEWEDCIKSNKTRIIDIIVLVPNKNTQVYKEHVIYFIAFAFEESVTIIDWLANMKHNYGPVVFLIW